MGSMLFIPRQPSWLLLLLLLLLPTTAALFFWAPLEEDNSAVVEVEGIAWAWPWISRDSYSVGNRCYCFSTFDHDIGNVVVEGTPLGEGTTIREICDFLGTGPGSWGRPLYNDIQCGNGPPNKDPLRDEITCPGRVEYGAKGCGHIGPKWNFEPLGADEPSATGFWTILPRFSNQVYLVFARILQLFTPILQIFL